MTKIILRKTTKYSAIFLAAILVAGTFALSNSSFMVGAQAQQFNGMDQKYNSYEPDYGMDNSYDKRSYDDSYDKKPYGNSYGQDYPSDYKKDYSSYGKELTCEDCFTKVLTDKELDDLIQAIIEDSEGEESSLQEVCEFIANNLDEEGRAFLGDRLLVLGDDVGISEDKINEILDCLEKVFGGEFPREIIINSLTVQQHMNWKS